MKIVVLDDYFVGFGGISWDPIAKLGDLVRYPATTEPDDAAALLKDADAAFVNRCRITAAIMEQCPRLRFIGTFGTGFDCVDINSAKLHGITVCNIPSYGKSAVAQMAVALLFAVARKVSAFDQLMKTMGWNSPSDSWICSIPQMELSGKTIGILGMGDIGYAVARIAMAMDMKVLAYRRTPDHTLECDQLRFCSLDELLAKSDIVSIHCPLNAETRGLINKDALAKMKQGAILINTARGAVLNEQDVLEALDSGKLAGAGVDVFSIEPPGADCALAKHPRCIATPHVAWMPLETRQRVVTIAGENLRRFLENNPQNVIV